MSVFFALLLLDLVLFGIDSAHTAFTSENDVSSMTTEEVLAWAKESAPYRWTITDRSLDAPFLLFSPLGYFLLALANYLLVGRFRWLPWKVTTSD